MCIRDSHCAVIGFGFCTDLRGTIQVFAIAPKTTPRATQIQPHGIDAGCDWSAGDWSAGDWYGFGTELFMRLIIPSSHHRPLQSQHVQPVRTARIQTSGPGPTVALSAVAAVRLHHAGAADQNGLAVLRWSRNRRNNGRRLRCAGDSNYCLRAAD